MTDEDDRGSDEDVLTAQIEYYRALAPEYLDSELEEPGADELVAAVEAHAPRGEVLELACGPGTWTPRLLQRASRVTAVDAAPEMLALARVRVGADVKRVRFLRADLFGWEPDQRYDGVFMGFWLSHVPPSRFAAFWQFVDRCLLPGGSVLFVDDAHRTDAELVEGAASTIIQRRLVLQPQIVMGCRCVVGSGWSGRGVGGGVARSTRPRCGRGCGGSGAAVSSGVPGDGGSRRG